MRRTADHVGNILKGAKPGLFATRSNEQAGLPSGRSRPSGCVGTEDPRRAARRGYFPCPPPWLLAAEWEPAFELEPPTPELALSSPAWALPDRVLEFPEFPGAPT